MTPLDDRLSQAVSELREDVDNVTAPPFVAKRSAAPVMLVVVVLFGLGIAALVARSRTDPTGGVAVSTQPDEPAATIIEPDEAAPEPAESAALADDQELVEDVVLETMPPMIGHIAKAEAGEFLMPLPAAVAWSNDESRLLMYRTGSASPGHFIIEAATGRAVGASTLPFTPADIEQIYWHPTDNNRLVYTRGPDVMFYNVDTGQSTRAHSFDQCDRVDSGLMPVPPASDGTLSLLCHRGLGREQLIYNLTTGEVQQNATSGDTAAVPSPSGRNLVRWNADGSASVLDPSLAETGVVLELENNRFVFVVDSEGREWVATTLFDGPAVGSIVVLPVDGADPAVVVIGPERGDAYPPSGTSISANGGVVAVAIEGADDGSLAGRVTAVDVSDSFTNPDRVSFAHESQGLHGYWSTPFLSVSPSGQFVAYATDLGTDRVETFVARATSSTD